MGARRTSSSSAASSGFGVGADGAGGGGVEGVGVASGAGVARVEDWGAGEVRRAAADFGEGGARDAARDAEGGGGGDEGEDEQGGEGADAVMAGASTATIMGGPTVLSAPGTAARKRIRAELSEDAVMASPVKRGRTNEDADEAESADANPLDMAAPAPRSRRTRKLA